MKGKYFLDTNIFIYTFDPSSPQKQSRARKLVSGAIEDRQGAISFQVIQEFLSVATRKFKVPLDHRDCALYLRSILAPLCEVYPSIEFYRDALDIQERWRLSFYDSLIVAAAIDAGCDTLFSEDLQHGMVIRSLTIEDPFR
jgi:predicted nucleic acid-binding protein